jgi:hypothetical protein
VVQPSWFDRVDARMADIIAADYASIIGSAKRVLLLWDAHGFEIAEIVLGEILPRLAEREHLVLLHDISDNRYAGVSRSYGGQPLWKGSKWQERTGAWNSRINIGWMNSIQDQVIALADFSARNDIEIGSADHEYATFFRQHADYADEMHRTIGEEMFSTIAHLAFLSLSGKSGPFYFPAVIARRSRGNRTDVVIDEVKKLPAALSTAAQAWAYAAAWTWRPAAAIPTGTDACLRVRVRVDGGAIGVSLLSRDEKSFVESKIVGAGSTDVLLPVSDPAQPGRLVVHAWELPIPAKVTIDDVCVVW